MKLILIAAIFLVSCSHLSFEDYSEYKAEHSSDYSIDTLVSNTTYALTYVPLEDLIVANSTTLELKELKAEYTKMKLVESCSFQLRIVNANVPKKQQKTLQTEYFSIDLKKDIKAITLSGDTLDCSHFLFIQNGNMGNEYVFEMDFQTGIGNLSHILFSPEFPEQSTFKLDLRNFHKKYPSLKI